MKRKPQRAGAMVCFVIVALLLSHACSFAEPVAKDTALKVANMFLQTEMLREHRVLTETDTIHGRGTISLKGVSCATIKELHDRHGIVCAYVTALKPEGFIITAADDAIGPLLGYSFKGSFVFADCEDNVLLHLVQWDTHERLRTAHSEDPGMGAIARANSHDWSRYVTADSTPLAPPSASTQWGPLINCDPNETWGQSFHFNKFCPVDPTEGGWRSKVGCVAVSVAQILAYWQYPHSIHLSPSEKYTSIFWHPLVSPFSVASIDIDGDSEALAFPTFDTLNSELGSIHYCGDPNEQAYLCFAVGIKHKMNYSHGGSGTLLSAEVYRKGLGYGSARSDSALLPGLNWAVYQDTVVDNIRKGWPVQIAVREGPWGCGHSVVVDGYKSTGEFHINCGMEGEGDWWYFLPIIDTAQAPKTGSVHFNLIYQIVYNICPYSAWSQFAADAKNTRMIPYAGPEEHMVRWMRSTVQDSPGTQLATAIVGTDGNVLALCRGAADETRGSLLVITPHGELRDSIDIPPPAVSISEPVQASGGPVAPIYFAVKNTVYRLVPACECECEVFYEDASRFTDFIYPTKIDTSGNIYATAWDKVCSIDVNGVLRWARTLKAISSMAFAAGPAINDDSGRVYTKYHDQDKRTGHLWALDEDTGEEIWDRVVPDISTGMAAAGEPTIGPDGTIYARFFKSLHAYGPDGSLRWEYSVTANQEWLEAFVSVGPHGNIYIGGGSFTTSPKYAWIRSLRTADKELLWEFRKQYPSDGKAHAFLAPLVAYENNMVYAVLNEVSSGGYRKLYALKEGVAGVSEMWEHEGAEDVVLGSTGTAYLLDRRGNQIIALSGGEVGDPEGAGMAYGNNSGPSVPGSPTPANGSPDEEYCTSLLLRWQCSDPDGHGVRYDVYLGERELGLYARNGWGDTDCAVTGLRPGTGYLWKVVATDGQAVAEGPTWAFATRPAKTDLNGDGSVNFPDLALIVQRWMNECSEPDWCDGCDLDRSGATEMRDVSIFVGTWLLDV